MNGLQPSTKYYGIITATDANGKRDYATGQFMTDGVDVLITMHYIHVAGDGDDGWHSTTASSASPGAWATHTTGVRGERDMASNSNISFADHESTYIVHDATGDLPEVGPSPSSGTADGKAEFCTGGLRERSTSPGTTRSCDWKWNVAIESDRPGRRPRPAARLRRALGIDTDADGCLRIESEDHERRLRLLLGDRLLHLRRLTGGRSASGHRRRDARAAGAPRPGRR